VPVQIAAGQAHETAHLVDWEHPEQNDFALAEEVTLKGGHQRRPDIVHYLNGLAIAVIELKRSSVELADGVRQLITNQEGIFNKGFFSTVQLVLAGSDSQGLHYGTTGTPEQRFWNCPRVAIEEAIFNAVYHRSYEEREPIEVRISPEDLVVLSFPGPDRSVRMEDLRAGRAVSRRYRNRRIGEFLKELDLTEGRSTCARTSTSRSRPSA